MNEHRWKLQLEHLAGPTAPVSLAASLRHRAGRVVDEPSMRLELADLGYDDKAIKLAARRARGGMRRPRFARSLALATIAAAAIAHFGSIMGFNLPQCAEKGPRTQVSSVDELSPLAHAVRGALEPNLPRRERSGKPYNFTDAANESIEGRFERYVRAASARGILRVSATSIWHALAQCANQHGWCHPSIPKLAEMSGTCERTVQRCIVILEELGLLLVFPREMERELPREWLDAADSERADGRSHMYLLLPGGLDPEEETSPALAEAEAAPVPSTPPPRSPASAGADWTDEERGVAAAFVETRKTVRKVELPVLEGDLKTARKVLPDLRALASAAARDGWNPTALDILRHKADNYFRDNDPYLVERGHPFALLMHRTDAADLPRPPRPAPPALPVRPAPAKPPTLEQTLSAGLSALAAIRSGNSRAPPSSG